MPLSAQEKLVLQTVLLQARHSVDQIAEQLSIRSHTIRRIVARLEAQKVLLGIRAYVNPYPLGLQVYQVFFSLPQASTEQHDKLIAQLCTLDGVGLLSELGGDPQYELHFFARNSEDAVALLDALQKTAPQIELSGLSLVHEQYYSGALGYLKRNITDYKPLRYGNASELPGIDRIDHSLLCLLANESINSHRVIAQKLKLPESTVSYRVRGLEERGLIAGYYHLCDFKPLGLLPVVGLLQTSVLGTATRARLVTFCNRHPSIAYVDLMVGPISARVFVRASSYEEARQVMCDLRETFSDTIKSIRIMPQLRFMRHSTYPFSAN